MKVAVARVVIGHVKDGGGGTDEAEADQDEEDSEWDWVVVGLGGCGGRRGASCAKG